MEAAIGAQPIWRGECVSLRQFHPSVSYTVVWGARGDAAPASHFNTANPLCGQRLLIAFSFVMPTYLGWPLCLDFSAKDH